MSRGANLSIMGLYNNDPTVLDMMVFPDGFTDAQKTTTKENILIECAEFEFLYPAPEVAKTIIGIWSRKELPYWNRVYTASQSEYNPIENYRRSEIENISDGRKEQHSGSDVNTASGVDTNAKTGTDTVAQTGSDSTSGTSSSTEQNSGTDTVTNKVTGYDSNTLVNHDQSDTVHGHVIGNQATGSNTVTYGKTDTETLNTLETITHGTTDTLQHGEKIEHEGQSARSLLAYGNIGVTTSQEMLTQELELAKIIEVVPIIIESFKNRFCLMVY